MEAVREQQGGRGLRAALRRRMQAEEGVSLVELLVAFTVLAIVMTGVASSAIQATAMSADNRDRLRATNLATEQLETLRLTQFDQLPVGASSQSLTRDGVTYQIDRELQWIPVSASTSACLAPTTGPGSSPAYLRANVIVRWADKFGGRPVTMETILTPPVDGQDPYRGHIAVVVRNRDGVPTAGHTVRITAGGVNTARTTDSQGCAFFANLTTGSYAVEVSRAPAGSHVDRETMSSAPTKTVTVEAAATSSVEFEYDRASFAVFDAVGQFGGVLPAALQTNLGITLRNTALGADQMRWLAWTARPLSTTLYPYGSGYEVWVGRCLEGDPARTGAAAPVIVGATPGGTDAVTLTMATVHLRVTRNGATNGVVSTVDQTLHVRRPASAPVDSCDPTWTPQALSVGATVRATGVNELTFVLPYGPWEISTDPAFPATAATRTVDLRADATAATAVVIRSRTGM
jgi:type II secretory pathway pseudopilin PulG